MSDAARTSEAASVPGSRAPAAGGGDVDEKFDELAGAVFEHCRQQLSNHDDEDDESFPYPIVEQQQKRKLQQQLSNRYTG